MPDFDLGTGKRLAGYSLVLGIVYLVFGLIEVFGGTGETIPGDVFGGLALLVIASTYLNVVVELSNGEHRGLSFLIGGLLLSAVFGVLYPISICADGLEYLIGGADMFPVIADIRPEIWLFLASLPLVYQAWKLTRDLIW